MSIVRQEVMGGSFKCIPTSITFDARLSLKAFGLLMKALLLPADWNFSIVGFASICGTKESGVRTGLQELEEYGYLRRRRIRDDSGRIIDMEYIFSDYSTKTECFSESDMIKDDNIEKEIMSDTKVDEVEDCEKDVIYGTAVITVPKSSEEDRESLKTLLGVHRFYSDFDDEYYKKTVNDVVDCLIYAKHIFKKKDVIINGQKFVLKDYYIALRHFFKEHFYGMCSHIRYSVVFKFSWILGYLFHIDTRSANLNFKRFCELENVNDITLRE